MSEQAARLMGNSFYEKMIEDLDRLPPNVQEWIKGTAGNVQRGRVQQPMGIEACP